MQLNNILIIKSKMTVL